jgi:hypothetical protein
MPFTPEQIEANLALTADYRTRFSHAQHFETNLALVTDYLTAKSSSIQGLQPDSSNQIYYALIRLLGPLDPSTPDDQLVLDVLLDQAVFLFNERAILDHLAYNCVTLDTPTVIQSSLGIFQAKGLTAEDLFIWIIPLLSNITQAQWEAIPAAAPLKSFLSANIPTAVSRLIDPRYTGWNSQYGVRFNPVVFYLLEKHRPALLDPYIQEFFSHDDQNMAGFLAAYKDGAYLSVLQQVMAEQPAATPEYTRQLTAAIRFFFIDKDKYRDPVLRIAGNFLQHWRTTSENKYESRLQVPELKEARHAYIPCTVVAWFLLLQYDPSLAVARAQEWLAAQFPPHDEALELFCRYAGEDALPLLLAAATQESASLDFRRTAIGLLVAYFTPEKYIPTFWELISHKSKPLRDYITRILAEKDPAAESKAIPLLQHKKAEIRQSAAVILNLSGTPTALAAMAEALDKESNDNARDILLETLADSLPEHTDKPYVDALIAAAASRGKLNKPSPALPDESVLPELFYTTGEMLDTPAIRFLLYRMSRCKAINSDIEARYLIRLIDKTRSAPFAAILLKIFLDKEAPAEEKYLMLTAALLGNEDTAASIRRLIDSWIENNRFKMAEYGVGALAIQGSDKALRWVEWYSRKYAVKKANIGAAATAALEAAAAELGITTYELGDRVIPDFGFDGLFRHFEAGGESYRAFIDSKFKLAFFNDNNKKLKALPASATEDLKQEFKAITKEIRDIVKSQSPRLEYYLIIQRRWTCAEWQKFFLENPVMFIYATRLLWGVYKDGAGTPGTTFICDEDTTLLDLREEEVSAEPEWNIGIVHPSQLDPATLKAWQEKFFDRAIEPIFPQLDRKQADLEGLDLSKSIIRKFDGRRTQTGSIRSTLDKLGWHPGPTGDGGMIGTYHLRHDAKKLEAIVEMEGVGAGFGWTGDERIGRLYFARRDNPRKKWWHYPKDDADPLLIPLKEIPTLFLHEKLAALDTIRPAPASE